MFGSDTKRQRVTPVTEPPPPGLVLVQVAAHRVQKQKNTESVCVCSVSILLFRSFEHQCAQQCLGVPVCVS